MNVALVTIDSLRPDHMGCYGYDRDTTPHLDKWADEGHLFENTFAHACATRPSFPSILSSVYSLMYGGFESVSEKQTLVSEVAQDAGYTTGGFHSNLYLSSDFGYDRGWDRFYDSKEDKGMSARVRQWVKNNVTGLPYRILETLYEKTEEQAGFDFGSYYDPADETTDRALRWVRNQDGDVFLWVHYMDPHHPYVPPEEDQKWCKTTSRREGVRLRRRMLEEEEDLPKEDLQRLIDLYDAEIRYTDREVNRLLSALDSRWDEWTGIVTADHGEEFLEHGDFAHHNKFYDETIHVPLIVYDGWDSGRYDELVGLNDIPPTISDLVGGNRPETWQGNPITRIIRGDEWNRDSVLGCWGWPASDDYRFMWRTREEKYILDETDGTTTEMFFDLTEDPREQRNVIAQVDYNQAEVAILDLKGKISKTGERESAVEMSNNVRQRLQNLGYHE